MGGSAFTKDGISTPRMPPEIYASVKAYVLRILRQNFVHAHVPIEAPEKTSYGDIDVLVCGPSSRHDVPSEQLLQPENLAVLLHARLYKRVPGSGTINFAISWPRDHSEMDEDVAADSSASPHLLGTSPPHLPTPRPSGRHIQIDVHVCSSPAQLHWLLFDHAHGDMWNLLGSMIRRFGLVRNDKALYLLIPELNEDGVNKHLQKVKMTDDARVTLQYLGLDWERYWKPFDSMDEMLDYAASCRFHDPARGRNVLRGDETTPDTVADTVADTAGEEKQKDTDKNTELGGFHTKANDRRRAAQRPIFQTWLKEYLSQHVLDEAGSAAKMTREEVVEDAKAFFGSNFAARFDQSRATGRMVVGSQKLWASLRNEIKARLGEARAEEELGYAMKGLKRSIQGEGWEVWCQGVLQRAARAGKEESHGNGADQKKQENTNGEKTPAETGVAHQPPPLSDSSFTNLGFEVPGIEEARQAFRDMEVEKVREWVLEGNRWEQIGWKQREKDERDCGEKLRMKMERLEAAGSAEQAGDVQ